MYEEYLLRFGDERIYVSGTSPFNAHENLSPTYKDHSFPEELVRIRDLRPDEEGPLEINVEEHQRIVDDG